MTLWQDPPPQTRRQARESERAAALQAENAGRSRRAGTAAPTTAGEIPDVSTPFGANSTRDTERESGTQGGDALGQAPVTRPVPPRYDGVKFDTLVKPPRTSSEPAQPALSQPASSRPEVSQPELFQPASAGDRPEPVTRPVSLVAPPARVETAQSRKTDAPKASSAPERTLTRRELRALLQAQQANSEAAVPAEEATQQSSAPEPAPAPEPSPTAVSAQSFADILSPGDELETQDSSEPRPYQPPTGHWSIAAEEPDDGVESQHEPGYARSRVSSGSVTSSNALILPTVPSIADATGPLTSTGEILVTGSIDLPRSLGSTGTNSDRFDSSDIDRLFEQSEGEQNTPNVAPIRASRAVSTHTSTRDTITPRRHPGNKLPTVLAITAAVLALGVVGLLVAGYIFKVF